MTERADSEAISLPDMRDSEAISLPEMRDDEDDAASENSPAAASWGELLRLASKEGFWIFLGCFFLLLRLPFSLASPHYQAECLGAAIAGKRGMLKKNLVFLIGTGVINSGLDFFNVFLFDFAKAKLLRRLRVQLFEAMLAQETAYRDKKSTGWLASRLTADTAEMGSDCTWVFRWSIESVVRIVGITVYFFVRDYKLAIVVVCIVPPVTLINYLYGTWLRQNASQVQAALAKAGACSNEALAASKTVVCNAAEAFEVKRYSLKIDEFYRLNVKQAIAQSVSYMYCFSLLVGTAVPAAILWYGGIRVVDNDMKPSILIAFMLYQGQLLEYTGQLLNSFTSLLKSSGSGGEVFKLLNRQPKTPQRFYDDKSPTVAASSSRMIDDSLDQPLLQGEFNGVLVHDGTNTTTQGRIEFRCVEFRYGGPRSPPALRNVSFVVEPQSSLSVVGPSGAGKSSIFNLIYALYEISGGAVLLDGVDVAAVPDLRTRALALVDQEPVLMEGTVAENILYGAPVIDLARCEHAAKIAQAHDFIIHDLPNGYDTDVGERGCLLSGGQKQRVAIARAVARNPKVLLLDEATSALPAFTDSLVRAALKNASQHRTTIAITHRLDSAKDADKILVLKSGHVDAIGTHDELLQDPDGLYASLHANDILLQER